MEATKHFGKIEGAKFMTDIEIVERYNATEDVAPKDMRRSIHNFASLYELEDTLASTKMGRAPGPDSITDDLAKIAPKEMARHLHPVITKVALRTSLPKAPG